MRWQPTKVLIEKRELLAAFASLLAIVVAVVVFAGLSGGGAQQQAEGPRQVVAVVGDAAPSVVVPTMAGDAFDVAGHEGRPVWINVWASWCPPCRVEFPDLDAIRLRAEPEGLVFVAMNFGEDRASIESFIRNTGYSFTVGLDVAREFELTYGVRGLPMHLFIAADGTLDSIRVGGMTPAEMEEKVNELLLASFASAASGGGVSD